MDSFSGSMVAIVTPMTPSGALDLAAYERLLEMQLRAGTSGIAVAGTTGEGVSLRSSELRELIKIAVSVCDGKAAVLAGVGGPATRRTIKLGDLAMRYGCDGLLVVTPSYLKTTQRGLIEHFRQIAIETDAPIVLYNVPSRTALDLLPETTAELASTIENIVGIKEAVGERSRIEKLRTLCGADFAILSGDDATWLEAMHAGADGVISVSSNLAPKPMFQQYQAFLEQDNSAAQALDERLQSLHRWTMSEPNPIPVKAALVDSGLISPGLRLPLVPATLETLAQWHDLKPKLVDLLIEEET